MIIFFYFIFIKLILCFVPIPKENGFLNSPYNHQSTDNLYFIFEHFRHGARSPCNGEFINNTDDLGGKWQNYGFLSKVGIKQHYTLGQLNRKRYNNFISNTYNSKEIKVFCSNYNRTMMSAQSQLLGFYNSYNYNDIKITDDIISEELMKNKMNITSIIPPVNLIEEQNNIKYNKYDIIFSEKFRCPIHKQMIQKNIKEINKLETFHKLNSIQAKFNRKYSDIFIKEFNMRKNYTHNYTGMYTFCDIYICHYFDDGENRLRIDNIEKKYKNFKTIDLLNMCYDYFQEKFFKIEGAEYAKESSVIIMSKIVGKIVNYMENRINKKDPKYIGQDAPKFILYSGHDDTLTQMQLFLNKFFNINTEWVPFASTQIFELRKYGNNFFVELYYNNRLKMNITFQKFVENVKKSVMDDEEINEKCYGFRRSKKFPIIFGLILVLIFMFVTFISTCIYYYLEKRKYEKPPKLVLIA